MSNAKSWKKQIEEAVSSPVRVDKDNVFLKTIQEFVETLDKSPYMRAELKQDQESEMRTLFVWPKYRRDMRSAMLSFWITPKSVTVLGGGTNEIVTPDALRSYFVKFATRSAFPQTVQEFAQICKEDVYGTLRTKSLRVIAPDDVVVVVPAADQKRLAEVAEKHAGDGFSLKVALEADDRLGKFSKSHSYAFLESGGYGLALVMPINTVGKRVLSLKGTVLGPSELAAAA